MTATTASKTRSRLLAPEERLNKQLTGRGGIGLVCYHLARRRIEFVVMPDLCASGDIWAQVDNRKFGIEVKTSFRASAWQIKKSQLAAVEHYVLVAMDSARCFILTPGELSGILDTCPRMYGDVHMVKASQIPDKHRDAWGRIDGRSKDTYGRNMIIVTARGSRKSPKTVRKTLADGSVKTYTYPRVPDTQSKIWKPSDNYQS